jgi:hypothetical protein
MATLTAKLCNPTPWAAKLDWDRGVKIRVPAFGDVALTMQQLDDFRSGKPGSEAVEEVLNYFGLFVMDADRPYDNQALDSLKRCRNAMKAQYDSVSKSMRDRRAQQGIAPNEEALEESLEQHGYVTLRNKVQLLDDQIRKYEKVCGPETERAARNQLDPTRTVFVLDPPREFPSVAAMHFFLEQNPGVAAKHEAYSQRAGLDEAQAEAVSSVEQLLQQEASE